MQSTNPNAVRHSRSVEKRYSHTHIYIPLGSSEDPLANKAQSKNTINLISIPITHLDQVLKNSIKVYPNPALDKISVGGLENKKEYNCRVFSIDGRSIINEKITGEDNTINISSLQSACYILEVEDILLTDKSAMKFLKIDN